MNSQAINNEVTTNPVGLPYLAMTVENAVANANVINNTDAANPRTVEQDSVDSGDIRGATTFDAFDGLVAAPQAWLEWLTGSGDISVTEDSLQKLAGVPIPNDSIWAASDRDEMNPAMEALMLYQGSRAQEIDDVLGGSYVSPDDMRTAVNP